MKIFYFAGDAPLEEFPDAEDASGLLQMDLDSNSTGRYLNICLSTDDRNHPIDITLRYSAVEDFYSALRCCTYACTENHIYRFYECEKLAALVNVGDEICVLYGYRERVGLILNPEDINLILKAFQPYTPYWNCPKLSIYLDTGGDE